MRIAVIGGGIGGLSAALQLLKAGLDVHVYEQAERISEIGAGIQISPNASRLLLRLGLKAAMDIPELNSFGDREVKPLNIGLHIGRRPLLAFGNSDGDLAMMRYVKSGPGARLALLLHHDDAEREVAYDREFRLSPLAEAFDKAHDYGITVVSMRRDWKVVF